MAAPSSCSAARKIPGTATSPSTDQRRAIQMNWVTDKSVVAREQSRHAISSTIKKLNPFRKAS